VDLQALELKIPPPAIAAVLAGAMWGFARVMPLWGAFARMRIGVTTAMAAFGLLVSAAAIVAFVRARTTINPTIPGATSALVSSGVFRFTRNPMYLGLLCFLIAWAAFLSSAWALCGPAAFVAYIGRFQIAPEERALSAQFGAKYAAYQAQVRRWL
jgi:protein-S-isoprenylcysteine O-methyltransferase Ste14